MEKKINDRQPDCYKCVHRGSVPGDAHSCCRYPGTQTGMLDMFHPDNLRLVRELQIRVALHGFVNGWACWPVNFDPVWLQHCNGFLARE